LAEEAVRIKPGKTSLATILLLLLTVSLTAFLIGTEGAHATPLAMPILGGWGGTRLKDTSQNLTGPVSLVFPGERASNFEQIALEQVQSGYNTIRASFAPYCSVRYGLNSNASPQDFMGNYSATQLGRALKIAEYFNMWIVVDYHGYSDFANSTLVNCWLNFWLGPSSTSGPTGVVGEFKDDYSRIIWEPLNEPASGTFPVSSTTWCQRNPLSCEASRTSYAGAQYQAWLDAARQMGDAHFVVVQNLCSYGCSRDRSHWYLNYPNVTDSQNRVFESLHTYMYYPAFVEHVAYDSNGDGMFDSGDIQIVGSIANGAVLTGDPKMGFVNTTNSQNEIWSAGKAIVYDVSNDGRYGTGDIPITGTVPPIGTPLKFDPKLEFVDSDGNRAWDGWSNATADYTAHQDYLTMLNETVREGWPILNTEGGAPCSTVCPYLVPGPAGYSSISLRYVQDIINYADNSGLRIGRLFWVAASWTSTPSAGIYGALSPGQWGTLLSYHSFPIIPIVHDLAVDDLHVASGTVPAGTSVQVNVTVHNLGDEPETTSITLNANNTTVGVQVLTDIPPQTAQEVVFTWTTGGSGPGVYVLKAVASQVQGETDLSDNYRTIMVKVTPRAVSGTSGPGTGIFDLLRTALSSFYIPIVALVILGGTTIALHHRLSLRKSTIGR
jgi:Cellulase (glycosyl hydrolase family 5)/CARDB